ncbi:helix-turn-helix transcriptional regulator [Kutzneria sp. NPDC051319]|uniref:PadR family transcriptional regulator n=1 Tax=Kutzneria sp. NPDC051319 TaxID=3155047 RepID=UPI003418A9F3
MALRGHLSPVAIAVLALLAEEPMHTYRMQQLMQDRGVGLVVNVRNRSGLHSAIERLTRDDLIRVRAVERDARHPERTVHELTPHGRQSLLTGLRDNIAAPAQEFPLFPAVVSFLHLLSPQDARTHLELRADALQRRLTETQAVLTASREHSVPRLHLLEHEYLESAISAELAWVRTVSRDINAGTLTWEQYA